MDDYDATPDAVCEICGTVLNLEDVEECDGCGIDSYAGAGYGNHAINGEAWHKNAGLDRRKNRQQRLKQLCLAEGIKPKDLVGVPWRVAFALQDDGWYLRSDIIFGLKGLVCLNL